MSNARKLGNMTTHGLDGDFNVDPTDNTLVVDSTNNRVGIGSATPTTTLDITGTATATAFVGPLTGNVTGTTSSISNHNTDALTEGSTNLYFTNARADARAQLKIDALVDSAPNTLDTLNELAAALGDDANFSTTVTNSIAAKLPLAGGSMTGALIVAAGDNGLDVRVGTDKRILFAGNIGEIGSVAGFQAVNTAGNANTAFGIRATDIRFATGSDERVRITDTGVGIGMSTPFADLTVGTSTTFDNGSNYIAAAFQPAIAGGDSAGMLLGHYPQSGYAKQGIFWERYAGSTGSGGRGNLHFVNRDATDTSVPTIADTRMTITAEGNVGIGTTSPGSKLTVQGTLGDGSSEAYIDGWSIIGNRYQGNTMTKLNWAGGGARIQGFNSGVQKFEISANSSTYFIGGNVGIGTDSPVALLDVSDSTSNEPQIRLTTATATNYLSIARDSSTGHYEFKSEETGSAISFHTDPDGTGSQNRLHIDRYGNVGIGTTSPQAKLHVYNENGGNATDKATMLSEAVLKLQPHTTNSTNLLVAQVNNGNGIGLQVTNGPATANWDLALSPFGGRVGIGNTSPDQALTIGTDNSTTNVGYIRLRGHNELESNIYKTASYGIHMDTDSNSQGIRIDGGKLVLGISGNVGIGTETPVVPLDINYGTNGGWEGASSTPKLAITQTDAYRGIALRTVGSSNVPATLSLERAQASGAQTSDGDDLGRVMWNGSSGGYVNRIGAAIKATQHGAYAGGYIPARLDFATSSTTLTHNGQNPGSGSHASRFRINPAGDYLINGQFNFHVISGTSAPNVAFQYDFYRSTYGHPMKITCAISHWNGGYMSYTEGFYWGYNTLMSSNVLHSYNGGNGSWTISFPTSNIVRVRMNGDASYSYGSGWYIKLEGNLRREYTTA